jgi:hypothetical protein
MLPPESADKSSMIEADDLVEQELMLNRFNRLMGEITRGTITRNVFQPWEIDLLLDIDSCPLNRRRHLEIIRQYQKAVGRQLEAGPGPPIRLAVFLAMRAAAKEQRLNGYANTTRRPSIR